MKKKFIKIIIVLIIMIMLIPFPVTYKDGGSVEYSAIAYSVIKYHRLSEASETGYLDGWGIKIFGISVYDDWKNMKKEGLSYNDSVIVADFYGEYEPIIVELNQEQNSEEIKRIKELCINNNIINDPFSIPACPFDRFAIEFYENDKTVIIYPCNDDCTTMAMAINGDACYYDISMEYKRELDELLEKIVE